MVAFSMPVWRRRGSTPCPCPSFGPGCWSCEGLIDRHASIKHQEPDRGRVTTTHPGACTPPGTGDRYLAWRGMRRFHESRMVLQLSNRKQAVILWACGSRGRWAARAYQTRLSDGGRSGFEEHDLNHSVNQVDDLVHDRTVQPSLRWGGPFRLRWAGTALSSRATPSSFRIASTNEGVKT